MRPAVAVARPSSATPAVERVLERLAVAGVLAHAAFLSISVAGMQIGLAVALGALALLRLGGRRVWARSALDLPVLVLTGAAVLSVAVAAVTGAPPVGWHEATQWRSFLAAPVVLSALAAAERNGADPGASRRWALAALGVWAAAALLPSSLAWVQYWTGLDPLHALGLRESAVHSPLPFTPGRYAAVGFFKWYQRLAHNLQPPLCVAAAVAVAGNVPRRVRALLVAAALAASAAIVLTMSRAAWVSLALSLGLVAALAGGRARRLAVPVAVGASVAMLANPAVRTRLARLAVPGDNGDRLLIWRVCRAMVADRPLTGFGFGNLPRRSLPYYDRLAPDWKLKAWCHDTFLSAWAEGGPVLFAAVCAFWALLARAFWRWRGEGDALGRAAAAGALAGLAGTVANSLAHDLLYSSEATYGLGFALAIAAALGARGKVTGAATAPAADTSA